MSGGSAANVLFNSHRESRDFSIATQSVFRIARRQLQSSTMDPVRIAALLAPFVTEEQRVQLEPLLPRISTYIDILLRWNARINLTAIRNPEEIVTRHFGESLFAARFLFPPNASGAA